MRAWDYMPGIPAAGHVTSGGAWHPGRAKGCRKCDVNLPCATKQTYTSLREAQAAANRVLHRSRETVHPYRCEHHNGWHIGHTRSR